MVQCVRGRLVEVKQERPAPMDRERLHEKTWLPSILVLCIILIQPSYNQ